MATTAQQAPTAPTPAEPASDRAFHVEVHGLDYIPDAERWAKPRDLFGMWAGASVQIEYFVYGAILMTFGFTFAQAVSVIVIGNLSFFLLGICSLQGPDAGTTVFGINRASYGPNGSRLISLFNWLTQVGFEVEGLILIVGAAIVLSGKAGFDPGTTTKVVFVIVAVAIQFVLPFLGHATIVKVLRALIIPFLILFVVMLALSWSHFSVGGFSFNHTGKTPGAPWEVWLSGLAFTITLSGLGWTECGNDYSRYLPRDASKPAIVGWVFLGTAVPEILVMTLGAAVGTSLTTVGTSANAFAPFQQTSVLPAWFVVVFLIFCIIQLFAINSLDLYSSGVTLQALGLKVKRYQAVIIDSAICLGVTIYAVLDSSFSTYLKDFVDVVIVWIAPWMAIYLVDWALRKYRYVPSELQNTSAGGLYWYKGGVNWAAIVAQLLGMAAAMEGLNTTFTVPSWMNHLAYVTAPGNPFGRADFSIYLGVGVGAIAYLVLSAGVVRRHVPKQQELLSAQGMA